MKRNSNEHDKMKSNEMRDIGTLLGRERERERVNIMVWGMLPLESGRPAMPKALGPAGAVPMAAHFLSAHGPSRGLSHCVLVPFKSWEFSAFHQKASAIHDRSIRDP